MRRLTIIIAFILCTINLSAQGQFDFSDPTIPFITNVKNQGKATSGHAISASIIGLEYSYEQALFGEWSIIARAGFTTTLTSYSKTIETIVKPWETSQTTHVDVLYFPCPALTIEPRYYFNKMERAMLGKTTENNCANFWSLRTVLYTTDWKNPNLSVIPMFGMRRGNRHWFREYTFGAACYSLAYSYGEYVKVLPHINFRIGYTF